MTGFVFCTFTVSLTVHHNYHIQKLKEKSGLVLCCLSKGFLKHFSRVQNHTTFVVIGALNQDVLYNGVESYAHQWETTGSSSDSNQLWPFSKWELLLKERNCSQMVQILSF